VIARTILYGAAAGAAGTAILDATTYADMALRGRPASQLPQKVVKEIAHRAHVAPLDKPDELMSDTDKNRQTAFGALIGYADGLGTGAVFGAVRPQVRGISWFWAGIALGVATLVLSEGSATALGQTDPRKWGAAGWIADLAPRFLYGWVTALTFDALAKDAR
jgi:hypothetical protein